MIKKIILFYFLGSLLFSDVIPFSKKAFEFINGDQLTRGSYLIVLSNPDLYSPEQSLQTLGAFISLKKTQGFDVFCI